MARGKKPAREATPPPEDAQPRGAKDPRLGRVHDRILEAYGEICAGTPADRALKGVFRRARDLGASERAEVSEVVYGLVRGQRAAEDALGRALDAARKKLELLDAPIRQRMLVLAHLALRGAAIEELAARDSYAFKRVPGAIERIASGRLPPVKRSPAAALGLELSLPDFIVERLLASFGEEETRALGKALDGRAPVTLRVNTGAITRDEARERIAREHGVEAVPTERSPFGLILPGSVDLQSWPLFTDGAIELQDEGSQLVTIALGARPKENVLDGCAGAGGKTLALAAMTGNTGRVIALDPEPKKLEALKRRARRAGVTNVEAITGELEALPAKLLSSFDRVLVDAPCTGSGVFRRHPDARWRVTERELQQHVARQQRLLASGISAAKVGGVIAYATCSILHEENEALAEELMKVDGRVEPLSIAAAGGDVAARAFGRSASEWHTRIGPGPDERGPDGFFVALMVRRN